MVTVANLIRRLLLKVGIIIDTVTPEEAARAFLDRPIYASER
jgi:hypothetical protein